MFLTATTKIITFNEKKDMILENLDLPSEEHLGNC